MDKAYLILADGTVYEGESMGLKGEGIGELVFETSMGSFSETLSDHRYFGQMVVQTFPIIGSHGFVPPAIKGDKKPALCGYIVRELSKDYSNFQATESIDDYLKRNFIVGIQGIDTRALTRKLRNNGSMNAMITIDKKDQEAKLKRIKAFKAESPIHIDSVEDFVGKQDLPRVAVWDLGHADGIINMLKEKGISHTVFKGNNAGELIQKGNYNGIILSDGGGNPSANKQLILSVQKLAQSNTKILAIGLSHLLMALSFGLSIKHLAQGKHGSNHPIKALKHNIAFSAGHNTTHTVVGISPKQAQAEVIFVGASDNLIEGISFQNGTHKSVQFDVESKGSRFIFDEFIASL